LKSERESAWGTKRFRTAIYLKTTLMDVGYRDLRVPYCISYLLL
jgi:hypothetical protein